jgi:lipoprotein signal peptidase
LAIVFLDQIIKLLIDKTRFTLAGQVFAIFNWTDESRLFANFSQLPLSINQYFLSMVICYTLILLGLIIFFLKNKDLIYIKYGISAISLSVVSSLLDRIRTKSVIKLFHFLPSHQLGFSFSLDDVANLAGLILIVFGLYYHWPELSGKIEKRKTYLIDKNYQLRLAGIISSLLILLGISLSIYAYLYFKSYYVDLSLDGNDHIISTLVGSMLLASLLFGIICFFAIIIYTHRTVGPLVAFERFVDDRLLGRKTNLKLRRDDHLKQLEIIAEKIDTIIKRVEDEDLPPPPP